MTSRFNIKTTAACGIEHIKKSVFKLVLMKMTKPKHNLVGYFSPILLTQLYCNYSVVTQI